MTQTELITEILRRADATLLECTYSADAFTYFREALHDGISKRAFTPLEVHGLYATADTTLDTVINLAVPDVTFSLKPLLIVAIEQKNDPLPNELYYLFHETDLPTFIRYQENRSQLKSINDIYYCLDGNRIRFVWSGGDITPPLIYITYYGYLPVLGNADIYDYVQEHIVNNLIDIASEKVKVLIARGGN
jgi:hypothetical protein